MKKIKTKEQLENRLKQLERMYFDKFLEKSVVAVNEFLEHNPKGAPLSSKGSRVADNVCLHGAWIIDRANAKICTVHNPDYKNSVTRKIRKALGYTL